MIHGDADIQHGLAHLEIGTPAVQATISEQRFSAAALNSFFAQLRNGHRAVLEEYDSDLADVIGTGEHRELDGYGIFGQFAGRLSLRESGLSIVESVLHHGSSPSLQSGLRTSLVEAYRGSLGS